MDAGLIDQTCQKTPHPDVCVSSLKSDPRSSGADVKGLGIITVDVVKSKAIVAQNKVSELLKTRKDLQAPLKICDKIYGQILTKHVPNANEALRKGIPDIVEGEMSDTADILGGCEISFSGKSPITKLNDDVANVADVAAAIARILKN